MKISIADITIPASEIRAGDSIEIPGWNRGPVAALLHRDGQIGVRIARPSVIFLDPHEEVVLLDRPATPPDPPVRETLAFKLALEMASTTDRERFFGATADGERTIVSIDWLNRLCDALQELAALERPTDRATLPAVASEHAG